jgi:tRNA A-37 threonylcarbamoyl transferase component Bud32
MENGDGSGLADGQILDGTYRLLRVVGEGGMGVVYEATHARLAGRYAIKVLTQRLAESTEGFDQFKREARNTSLLQHPNIVQVIDHNTASDGTEYLVMEYLAGESLSHRLAREGRFSLDVVVEIIDQIAAGLSAAHAHGIVHRDLKPDNVVLVPIEGRQTELVKLLDFGISRRQGSLEVSGLVCGTPQYMAPEQVEGRVLDIDASTDQFALAVIAHELLTGRNPFEGDSVAAVFARVSAALPMPVGFGRDVDAVLARALAKSGRLRFRSVTDFSKALREAALAWGRASPRQATAPATDSGLVDAERIRMLRRRKRKITLGAAVTAIAAFFVAASGPNRLLTAGRAWSSTLASRFDGARSDPEQGRAEAPPLPKAEAVSQRESPQHPEAPVMQPIVEPQAVMLTARAQSPRLSDGDGSSSEARSRRPVRTRSTSPATRSPPSLAKTVDEDATMPPTETTAYEPRP